MSRHSWAGIVWIISYDMTEVSLTIKMLEIRNLSKSFGRSSGERRALDSVSLEVKDGEVVGFVGLNGAGKTTTIRIASGVALPTSGRVMIDGHDIVTEKIEASKRIGWVPEYPNFEMGAKAIDLMGYFCGFYEMTSREAQDSSFDLLRRVGLRGSAEVKLRTYWQVQKERFPTAAAMI